jgi:hypothetical protein
MSDMSDVFQFLETIPWFAWIPIIAIVGGITSGTMTKFVEIRHRHVERMAMIQQGMHPDAPNATLTAANDPQATRCKPAGFQEI